MCPKTDLIVHFTTSCSQRVHIELEVLRTCEKSVNGLFHSDKAFKYLYLTAFPRLNSASLALNALR